MTARRSGLPAATFGIARWQRYDAAVQPARGEV